MPGAAPKLNVVETFTQYAKIGDILDSDWIAGPKSPVRKAPAMFHPTAHLTSPGHFGVRDADAFIDTLNEEFAHTGQGQVRLPDYYEMKTIYKHLKAGDEVAQRILETGLFDLNQQYICNTGLIFRTFETPDPWVCMRDLKGQIRVVQENPAIELIR